MGRRLLSKAGIEESERELVAWGALALALVGWCDVSIQNAAETFFLKRVGVEHLPAAFLVSSLLLVASTYVVGRRVVQHWYPNLLPKVFVSLAVAILPLWLLVYVDFPGAFVLMILASKQIKAVALLVFWVAMGKVLNARQAKRLFAPLVGGLTVGTITGSFASEPVSRILGIDGLLYFAAAVMGVGALVAVILQRTGAGRLERGLEETRAERPRPRAVRRRGSVQAGVASATRLWRRSGLFRLLFVTTLCSGILGPMLYFQFSYVADLATKGTGGEQQLLALYAQLRGWINLAILLIQLAFASSLYRHIGVPLASALSPVIYALGFIGLSVHLSLPAGVTAVAGARIQDDAIYDPGVRILFNLFPEDMKSRATALLEGPIKRVGGTIGNIFTMSALALGSALWVGYAALPIVALWLVVALTLWRAYPSLLLRASVNRVRLADPNVVEQVFDPATLRGLSSYLLDSDVGTCQAAIALISHAPAPLAVDAFVEAIASASPETRPLLINALDRLLEQNSSKSIKSPAASQILGAILEGGNQLDDRERVILLQAYGQLSEGHQHADIVLEKALQDPTPAVRLAVVAALSRRGKTSGALPNLDEALDEAVREGDSLMHRTAARELFRLLDGAAVDATWKARLRRLAGLLDDPKSRADAAAAVAKIGARHGPHVGLVSEAMLNRRSDPDSCVRASMMRFIGYAGLEAQVPWLVEGIGSDDEEEAAAAREALLALGPRVANALMVEHSFGKRSTRDAILSIVRELNVSRDTLSVLYEREVESLQQILLRLSVLSSHGGRRDGPYPGDISPILRQRLEERIDEGLHTALLFVTAIHDEDRVAELDDLLRHTRDQRQRAILLEALETLLTPQEKGQLMPLLEESDLKVKGENAAAALGTNVPSFREAALALLGDTDELTRILAMATFREEFKAEGPFAPGHVEDEKAKLDRVEIAQQIHRIPIFRHLSARQLMDLTKVIRQESYPPGTGILREGDEGKSMYLMVDGEVEVVKLNTRLGVLGPGDFFGEMAIFERERRSASVLTRGEVRLLRLEGDDLLQLIEELPAIAVNICQYLSHRVQDLNTRLQRLTSEQK